MKLVIGITGSTGVIYGIRLLEVLKEKGIETNLVMSEWAKKCIPMETKHDVAYVESLATEVTDENNMAARSEEHTSELQSLVNLVCRLLLEKTNKKKKTTNHGVCQHV